LTALHLASCNGEDDLVDLLLDAGADPTIMDRINNETPEDTAFWKGYHHIVKRLQVSV